MRLKDDLMQVCHNLTMHKPDSLADAPAKIEEVIQLSKKVTAPNNQEVQKTELSQFARRKKNSIKQHGKRE